MLYCLHSKIEKERCAVKNKRFYTFLALVVGILYRRVYQRESA